MSVEKTSKRGGKIVNVAAERGKSHCVTSIIVILRLFLEQQAEQEKKRAQSLTDMLKNPTKVILLQVLIHTYTFLHKNNLTLLLNPEHGGTR